MHLKTKATVDETLYIINQKRLRFISSVLSVGPAAASKSVKRASYKMNWQASPELEEKMKNKPKFLNKAKQMMFWKNACVMEMSVL